MKNSGGSAFPIPAVYSQDGHGLSHGQDGMTLRDYFAVGALQGLLASLVDLKKDIDIEEEAYRIADCMIEARAK